MADGAVKERVGELVGGDGADRLPEERGVERKPVAVVQVEEDDRAAGGRGRDVEGARLARGRPGAPDQDVDDGGGLGESLEEGPGPGVGVADGRGQQRREPEVVVEESPAVAFVAVRVSRAEDRPKALPVDHDPWPRA